MLSIKMADLLISNLILICKVLSKNKENVKIDLKSINYLYIYYFKFILFILNLLNIWKCINFEKYFNNICFSFIIFTVKLNIKKSLFS